MPTNPSVATGLPRPTSLGSRGGHLCVISARTRPRGRSNTSPSSHDCRGSMPFKCSGYGTLVFNDCSDQCTPGAQPDLSLRLGPQIQTLLSREGQRTSGGRTGQSRSGSGGSVVRGGRVGSHTTTKAPDGPALEGEHFSWLRPAHADATQGRWQLSEPTRSHRLTRWPFALARTRLFCLRAETRSETFVRTPAACIRRLHPAAHSVPGVSPAP
jgi:hypothetical protein